MNHLHNWQWQTNEKWLCRDCGEHSDCTCKPTDPGPYHLSKCPRSLFGQSEQATIDLHIYGKSYVKIDDKGYSTRLDPVKTLHSLEQACIDVASATDSQGRMIFLCDALNIRQISQRMVELSSSLLNNHVERPVAESIARNVKLLAHCLELHMQYNEIKEN